jgi:hypothetical protein
MKAQNRRALYGRLTANLRFESGNHCRSSVLLTDAESSPANLYFFLFFCYLADHCQRQPEQFSASLFRILPALSQ